MNRPDQTIQPSEAGMAPAPAFTIMRGYKGSPHTYQVYFDRDRVCFIRIGAGPGADMAMAAHGGLVGALLTIWLSSRRKKKIVATEQLNAHKSLGRMLAEHKANHCVALADISDVSLEPGNWAMKKGTVLWKFQVREEKKKTMCTFRAAADIDSALAAIGQIFPDLRLEVVKEAKSGKYLKKAM